VAALLNLFPAKVALAIRNRGYTNKVRVGGLKKIWYFETFVKQVSCV